jgi:hypothetical protein
MYFISVFQFYVPTQHAHRQINFNKPENRFSALLGGGVCVCMRVGSSSGGGSWRKTNINEYTLQFKTNLTVNMK